MRSVNKTDTYKIFNCYLNFYTSHILLNRIIVYVSLKNIYYFHETNNN